MSERVHEVDAVSTYQNQFSLRTVFLATTDVGVLLSMCTWLGKDGLLLSGIILPLLTVPWFVQGPVLRKARITAAMALLMTGAIWSVCFPKTKDILRQDMLNSVLFGIGLVGSGILLLAVRKGALLRTLSVMLLWSLLMNVSLFNTCHFLATVLMADMKRQQAPRPAASSVTGSMTPTSAGTVPVGVATEAAKR